MIRIQNTITVREKQSLDDTISGSFEGIGAVMTIKDGVPMIAEPPIADTPVRKSN